MVSINSGWLILAALAAVHSSSAQARLEEVIVTAQKRTETTMDVPISISAVRGDNLQSNLVVDLAEMSSQIPNLQIAESPSQKTIYIRGQGNGGADAGIEQSVGLFVDGIYAGRDRQFAAPFLDIDRVEIMRGPQSLYFGKNTSAGALAVHTARPSRVAEGYISGFYETELDETGLTGVLSGPLSDRLAGRIAAMSRENDDGWLEEAQTGQESVLSESSAVRGGLLWDATDTLEVFLKAEYSKVETEGSPWQMFDTPVTQKIRDLDPSTLTPGQLANWNGLQAVYDLLLPLGYTDLKWDDRNSFGNSDLTGGNLPLFTEVASDTESRNYQVNVNWELQNFSLTSITGYSAFDFDYQQDVDFTGVGQISGFRPNDEFTQLSQEIRLTSPGGDRWDWMTGIYFQSNEFDTLDAFSVVPTPGLIAAGGDAGTRQIDYSQDSESISVFVQLTYEVSDVWRLSGGVRYMTEDKEVDKKFSLMALDGSGLISVDLSTGASPGNYAFWNLAQGITDNYFLLSEKRNEEDWLPSATLEWDATDNAMMYLSASRGVKGGGFNVSDVTVSSFEFEDERVTSFELGAKLDLFEGSAQLALAAYHATYDDLQTSSYNGVAFTVANAGQATAKGVEFDGRWLLSDSLMLVFAGAYLDSEYDEFKNASCTAEDAFYSPGCVVADARGNKTPYAPEWSGSLGVNVNYPVADSMELLINVNLTYSDEFYYRADNDPADMQDSYTKVDARLALVSQSENWEVALLGKNLTDEKTGAAGGDAFALPGIHWRFMDRPRTYALQATYRF